MASRFSEKQRLIGTGLLGQAVSLRLLTVDDCNQTYLDWLRDSENLSFLEIRFVPQTLQSITEYVLSMQESTDCYLFAIIENNSNAHIGNLRVGPINIFHGYTELSYLIGDKAFVGRGLATESVVLAVKFVFNVLNLRHVYAGAYGKNVASRRVLEKAGFSQYAVVADKYVLENAYDDHILFSLRNPNIRPLSKPICRE